jgi:hypothetical protein
MIKEDANKTVMQLVWKVSFRISNIAAIMMIYALIDVLCRAVVISFVL